MPVYKDKKTNTWYCKFYYEDYTGAKKQKFKRGFKLKKEAQEYEKQFLVLHSEDNTMLFSALIKDYKRDMYTRFKPSTIESHENIINKHIAPFFNNLPLNQITPKTVRKWQNELLESPKTYSQSYLNTIYTQLVAIFNYAIKYHGLKQNPASLCGSIGKARAKRNMTIWTLDDFKLFLTYEDDPMYYCAFNLLYYTGMRIGELMALTWDDIDLEKKEIHISKSLQRFNGIEHITAPKTAKSVRSIVIFDHLIEILKEYKKRLYEPNTDRLFNVTKSSFGRELKRKAKLAGLPEIRVHDLRHSHASLLIELGFNPVAIADRLGHESIKITLDTYSHLYPNKQDQIAQKLEEISKKQNF